MVKTAYVEKLRLNQHNKDMLVRINSIIEDYSKQGYRLTLRQLYYQLVSRAVIPNNVKEYAKLSSLLTHGRMAGIVDWDAIEDRLRVPDKPASWDAPQEIIKSAASQYRRDRMEGQKVHIEVWVEKDALSGVLKRITHKFGVDLMVNRGYSSTTAMHDAYKRFQEAWDDEKKVIVLYLGDHDPSGLDMVRDIRKRIDTFFGEPTDDDNLEVVRVALTGGQIKQYNPPPNPAKRSDPRAVKYIEQFGNQSWEVDALPPEVLNKLVTNGIVELIDTKKFNKVLEQEEVEQKQLLKVAEEWKD